MDGKDACVDEVVSVTDLPGSSRWQYAWER
jgi:hypothetical protein